MKEVCKMLELTEYTVRFYSDKGLIPSLERDKNNNRLFNQQSINWLIGIKNLRACGMTVNEIKNYIELSLKGDLTVPKRYELLLKRQKEVDNKLEELKKMSQYLDDKIKLYLEIMNDGIPDKTNPSKW